MIVFTDANIHVVATIELDQSIGIKAFVLSGFLGLELQHLLIMVVVMFVMILVMPFSHDDQYVMTLASSISVIVLETSDHLAAAC